ncbi:MAG: bifunctional 2-methylcitrate dehydratase/aconitate hydratase [Lentisphaeria bacterium]|nr:bifunctional 2-methylcitrate dehydratase/aconitate hydratase [Lentisphaeria bacterium]NQZ67836.1 bifunctional 2-methylcitrate dehydratase/aconitate hydratase [Lentisphaeria bacterium]
MSTQEQSDLNHRPKPDKELMAIADYLYDYEIPDDDELYKTARYCLMDSLASAFLACRFPACKKHLGPLVSGTIVPNGARVPGTNYILDPVKAAFDIGTMIRWLDFNDTWLAEEWGHPSDNLGAILALGDFISRKRIVEGDGPMQIKELLNMMIKAHEIQGVMALENSFNKVGLDHVVLVKVASTAVSSYMLKLDKEGIVDALSHAWVDGQSLRTYRHAPNTTSRKSWAAGDATSRAVRLALMVANGEPGMPSVLTTKSWGFYDVLFKSNSFRFQRDYQHYVMKNILFKISYPAEFHAQTAIEVAIKLHPQVYHRLEDIDHIDVYTQESAIRIISKQGPLHNPADRDHCLQYMIAVGLIFGELKADSYEDDFAEDQRIDELRRKMIVREDKQFSEDYLNPEKRAIANAIQVFFKDDSSTEKLRIDYPVGHLFRRDEAWPLLERKFTDALSLIYDQLKTHEIKTLCMDHKKLESMAVNEFMDLFVLE